MINIILIQISTYFKNTEVNQSSFDVVFFPPYPYAYFLR